MSTESEGMIVHAGSNKPVPQAVKLDDVAPTVIDLSWSIDIRRAAALSGFFTIAPLYYLLGIPFDLTQDFRNKYGACKLNRYKLSRPIITIQGWDNVLEAFHEPAEWEAFTKFMFECSFLKSGTVWAVHGKYVTIQLPGVGAVNVGVFLPVNEFIKIDVTVNGDNTLGVFYAARGEGMESFAVRKAIDAMARVYKEGAR